jgi:glycosyltransferase involved in cell wall biosynthesis
MRVAAFTGGWTVSSARFRVRQYIPRLHEHGIEVDEFVAQFGSWPPLSKLIRPLWAAATLAQRAPGILRSRNYDLTLLQREMVSTFATLERFTKAPRVLDVDDAVWVNRNTDFLSRLITISRGVICGNTFIADYVRQFNRNICVLPTPVDTRRYTPASTPRARRIIGWSGLSSGLKWVQAIENELTAVLAKNPDVTVRIVSDRPPRFSRLPSQRVEYIPWAPDVEVRTIQEMTVGLMPLDDSPLARGKCSYKMLLYMSCGVPVVVTPVGMNGDVLRLGHCGLGAVRAEEWSDAIGELLSNPEQAARCGREGRAIVEREFSLDTLAPRLAAFLKANTMHRDRAADERPV